MIMWLYTLMNQTVSYWWVFRYDASNKQNPTRAKLHHFNFWSMNWCIAKEKGHVLQALFPPSFCDHRFPKNERDHTSMQAHYQELHYSVSKLKTFFSAQPVRSLLHQLGCPYQQLTEREKKAYHSLATQTNTHQWFLKAEIARKCAARHQLACELWGQWVWRK